MDVGRGWRRWWGWGGWVGGRGWVGGGGGGETHDITVMMLELEEMGNDNGDLYNMSQ